MLSCLNKAGPPTKSKYDSTTDSVKYRKGKMKRTQPGSETEPEIKYIQALGAQGFGAHPQSLLRFGGGAR